MSKIEEAYKELKENNLINYGSIISKEELEKSLNIKMDLAATNENYWESKGLFLSFKEYIEKKGYFTTQRNHGDDLYILKLEEMADHIETIYARLKRIQKKASISMQMADASLLDEKQQSNHFHQMNKLSFLRNITSSVLRKRKRLEVN